MTATATIITRALAGKAAVSEHETDQRIIDAVLAELLLTPLRRLSLEDVARRAGITRMTVYRRFGDRERVIEAALTREVGTFLAGVAAADDPSASTEQRIADAFAAGLQLVHSNPLSQHILAEDPGQFLDLALADDGLVLAAGSAFLAAQIERNRRPGSAVPDAQRTGELLGRLFVALVLMPPPSVDLADPEQARSFARELIAPILLR